MSAYSKLLIFLVALFCYSCTANKLMMPKTNMIQSQNDNRHYQALTLANDLKILLISDPETKKAAASLDVFVGSASDPDDRAGLAHFLEHMLFLGTEKYPDADEYQSFMTQHGGSRNAFTSRQHTNYFFTIKNAFLEPALDRFSQFFIAPLFDAKFIDREKNAVNSEYLGKIKTENRRYFAGIQQAFNPQSPYAKFSVGSLETLADRENNLLRDNLLAFYKLHYSANLMTLVVLANEPLPVLKKWVTDKFSALPNHHAEKKAFIQPLLTKAQMARQINIKSLQEKRELSLIFSLPETQSYYLAKPSLYFQSLLGHEGEGSILALLKEKGWADEISASVSFSDNAQESSLLLSINLTHEGVQHSNEIIDIVFQYIRLLQNNDIQQWLLQEQKQMATLQFRYQEQLDASRTVIGLAQNLQYYAPEDVLRGTYVIEQFRPDISKQLLSLLSPDRVLIVLNTQNINTDQREKYYLVDYHLTNIKPELIRRWSQSPINPALSLPAANPFIPDTLQLKTTQERSPDHPELIQQNASIDVWHQLDVSFHVPRSNLYIALQSPIANKTPQKSLLASLFSGIIKKQLISTAYPAHLAGLNYSIYATERGISIALSGYNQKQTILLKQIIAAIKAPEITEQRFNILKARLAQKLTNQQKQQPFLQILAEIKRTMIERRWTNKQKLNALTNLTRQDLAIFIEDFLKQLHITMLLQGNNTARDAKNIAAMLDRQLALVANVTPVPSAGVIQLAKKSLNTRRLTIDHHDAVLAIYFQATDKSIKSQAEAQLLGRIISSAFFADLRTRQQLGYNLAAFALPIKEMPGIIFILQSPIISAPEIEARYRTFIHAYLQQLVAMTEQELESYKSGLMTLLLEKDKSLKKKSARNWLEIDRENTDFDTKERIAQALSKIDKNRLLIVYQDWLIDNPRQLRSYATGNQFSHDDFANPKLITDIDAFKNEHHKL